MKESKKKYLKKPFASSLVLAESMMMTHGRVKHEIDKINHDDRPIFDMLGIKTIRVRNCRGKKVRAYMLSLQAFRYFTMQLYFFKLSERENTGETS